MSTKGELRDCQSHHPEVTPVVVAIPLSIQAFPTKTEKQLLFPNHQNFPRTKPKLNSQPLQAAFLQQGFS